MWVACVLTVHCLLRLYVIILVIDLPQLCHLLERLSIWKIFFQLMTPNRCPLIWWRYKTRVKGTSSSSSILKFLKLVHPNHQGCKEVTFTTQLTANVFDSSREYLWSLCSPKLAPKIKKPQTTPHGKHKTCHFGLAPPLKCKSHFKILKGLDLHSLMLNSFISNVMSWWLHSSSLVHQEVNASMHISSFISTPSKHLDHWIRGLFCECG